MRLAVSVVNLAARAALTALRLVPVDQCTADGHTPTTEPGPVRCARCGKRPTVTGVGDLSWV